MTSWKAHESKFFNNPEEFLKLGQRVRAKLVVYDLPGKLDPAGAPDTGPIHAHPGDLGTVVHIERGFWPTVEFDKTQSRTDVTDFEVEPI